MAETMVSGGGRAYGDAGGQRDEGSLWATLRATGRAAHSSQPERGENAILKLTRALDVLDHHLGRALAGFNHPVLGRATLNVGVIRGGRAEHRAGCGRGELESGSHRSWRRARGACAAAGDVGESRAARWRCTIAMRTPMETPATHRWCGVVGDFTGHPFGRAPGFRMLAHFRRRVPSVCPRPGSIDQAHTVMSSSNWQNSNEGAAFLAEFIRRLDGE